MKEIQEKAALAGGAPLWQAEAVEHAVVCALEEYAVFALDGHGVICGWNDGAERLTGFAAQETEGRPYDQVLVGDQAAPLLEEILSETSARGRCVLERWWRRREGGRFPALENVMALPDGGYVVVARDTSDRRVAEEREEAVAATERALREELQSAERRASFLAEASSILVAASLNFDSAVRALARLTVSRLAEWCIIYAYDVTGRLRRAELAHRDPRREANLRELRGELAVAADDGPLQRVIRSGRAEVLPALPDEVAAAVGRVDGAVSMDGGVDSVLLAPLLGRGRALGVLLIVSSSPRGYNTEDVALVEELARRAAIAIDNARFYHEAQQANRAKSDFLAIMSHELRTPLNAIMGYTDLIDGEISGPVTDPQHRQLGRIRASARQLLQLIEEVLGFARLESGSAEVQLQRVPVIDLAREAVAVLEPFAEAKDLPLEFVPDLDPETRIESDPGKIRQILVNLLSNAVKFTAKGRVEMRLRCDADNAYFEIVDTGVGIDEEQAARIFDPFWQAERPNIRRAGGTGLGLSVSQRYARLLGGDIRVTSEPGAGSTFTVCLPLVYEGTNAEAARTAGEDHTTAQMRFSALRSRVSEEDAPGP